MWRCDTHIHKDKCQFYAGTRKMCDEAGWWRSSSTVRFSKLSRKFHLFKWNMSWACTFSFILLGRDNEWQSVDWLWVCVCDARAPNRRCVFVLERWRIIGCFSSVNARQRSNPPSLNKFNLHDEVKQRKQLLRRHRVCGTSTLHQHCIYANWIIFRMNFISHLNIQFFHWLCGSFFLSFRAWGVVWMSIGSFIYTVACLSSSCHHLVSIHHDWWRWRQLERTHMYNSALAQFHSNLKAKRQSRDGAEKSVKISFDLFHLTPQRSILVQWSVAKYFGIHIHSQQ